MSFSQSALHQKQKNLPKSVTFTPYIYQKPHNPIDPTQCLTTANHCIAELAPGMYFIGVTDSIGLNRLPHLGVCRLCVYRDLPSISLPSEVCGNVMNV